MDNTGILAIQFEPLINDIEANLLKAEKMILDFVLKNPEKKVDLIVLPEFFATGVSKSYTDFPFEADGGKPRQFLSSIAEKLKTYLITGTLVVKEGEKLYNKTFLLDRNGKTISEYRKIHLFDRWGGTENLFIASGKNSPVVVELDFGKLGLSICFDIMHPTHYKILKEKGAELVVSPSCWAYPDNHKGAGENTKRIFKALNIARAVENEFYFVTVNQAGKSEGSLQNIGHSMIIGPMGEKIAEAGEKDEAVYGEINLEHVKTQTETPAN